jgi:hypothetical protein
VESVTVGDDVGITKYVRAKPWEAENGDDADADRGGDALSKDGSGTARTPHTRGGRGKAREGG